MMFRTKDDLLYQSLNIFFTQNDGENMYKILPILQGKSVISLRLIDWFVTNYSKTHKTRIQESKRSACIVFLDYKAQLKAFSKKQFDPFCRRNRIHFSYTPTECIETTIGQLNFFRWAIQRGILQYLKTHREQIEGHLNKQNQLKCPSIKSASTNKHKNVRIILTFE